MAGTADGGESLDQSNGGAFPVRTLRDDPDDDARMHAFVVCWAIYGVIHQLIAMSFVVGHPANWAVVGWSTKFLLGGATLASSLVCCWKPSMRNAAVMAATFLAYEAYHLPLRPNHGYLTIAIELTFLGCLLWKKLRSGTTASEHYRTFAAAARLQYIFLYVFAVFHKLNADYLDPSVSCGAVLYADFIAKHSFIPDFEWGRVAAIYVSLAVEAGIPLLLWFRKTRRYGLALAVTFHLLLAEGSNIGITSFSCASFALLSLFLPRAAWETDVLAGLKRRWPLFTVGRAFVLVNGFALVTGVSVELLLGFEASSWRTFATDLLRESQLWRPIYAAVAVSMIAGLIHVARATRNRLALESPREGFSPALAPPGLLVLALVLLNGLTPYLGIKTAANYSMYSNLRVDELRNNHLLVRAGLPGVGHQDDLVEIIDSSDERIKDRTFLLHGGGNALGWRHPDLLVPSFELRRYLSEHAEPDLWIEYRAKGRTIRVDRRQDPDHILFVKPPWLVDKLLVFRPVTDRGQPQLCVW
jgi:hypothetical protein